MMTSHATHVHESRTTRALRAAPLVLLFLVLGFGAMTHGVADPADTRGQVAKVQPQQDATPPAPYLTAQYVNHASSAE